MSNGTLKAIVVAVVLLLALPLIPQVLKAAPTDSAGNAPPNAPPAEKKTPEAVPPPPPPEPAPPPPSIMTQAQFRQIRSGMTYAQCVQFIGSEGKPAGRDPGGGQQYSWQLVNGPYDAASTGEAVLTFRNGILNGKGFNSNAGRKAAPGELTASAFLPAQRPATPPYLCGPVYNSIRNGSTYAECARLLGMEGRYLGRRQAPGGTWSRNGTPVPAVVDVYAWHNPSIQATLTLSFRDGKLTAREMSMGRGAGGNLGVNRQP